MSLSKQTSFDLKTRVITSLNKLSDRDTLSIATNELDNIAKTLSNDAFTPFITCLSTIDSSDKLPLRRHSVRLLGLISAVHGDALSPHLSKILSSVIRRLRDSDSSVRSACVDAVSCIASHITGPPFSAISKPLIECLSHEQDCNSQVGASLCLAAAIEAAPEPEGTELKKLLPRLLKLVKNEKFKAKPALLSVIGSIAIAGGASGRNALTNLVPSLVGFLSSEEWSTRKAAAEALGKLALAESDLLSDLKLSCLASLANRRFDKVKVVRDSMNGAIELWKDVPGISDETESSSSSKDFVSNGCGFVTRNEKKNTKVQSSTDSSSSTTSSKNSNPLKSGHGKPKTAKSCKIDLQKPFDLKVEAVPQNPSFEYQNTHNPGFSDSEYGGNCRNPLLETEHRRSRTSVDNYRAFGSARYRARVVPLSDNQENSLSTVDSTAYDTTENQDFENFSLIQKQIYEIENQQSTLLDRLQGFIGHSYKGMNYLESRVNGLEKVLDELSHDMAISTRVSDTGAAAGSNRCCILPGADFLSPKFWGKTEEQYSSPKSCLDNRFTSRNHSPNMNSNRGFNSSSPIDNHQTGSMVSLKSTEFNDAGFTGVSGYNSPRKIWKTGEDTRNLQMRYVHRLGRTSMEPCMVQKL